MPLKLGYVNNALILTLWGMNATTLEIAGEVSVLATKGIQAINVRIRVSTIIFLIASIALLAQFSSVQLSSAQLSSVQLSSVQLSSAHSAQ